MGTRWRSGWVKDSWLARTSVPLSNACTQLSPLLVECVSAERLQLVAYYCRASHCNFGRNNASATMEFNLEVDARSERGS